MQKQNQRPRNPDPLWGLVSPPRKREPSGWTLVWLAWGILMTLTIGSCLLFGGCAAPPAADRVMVVQGDSGDPVLVKVYSGTEPLYVTVYESPRSVVVFTNNGKRIEHAGRTR